MTSEKRKYERIPYTTPIKYYLTALRMDKLEKIYNNGVSVDISRGGLGMITDFPLSRGDVLYFEPEIKINDSTESTSIVRWVLEIEENEYRAGLEFVK